MTHATGYAALSAESPMAPFTFERRALRADDVRLDIRYCGVCHSDLHQARDDWHNSVYPCVPGHEIIGTVTEVGPDVTRFQIGDLAAIGCMVDSCMACPECVRGQEQYCVKRSTPTYNGKDRMDGSPTYGGYSDHIVAREQFVLKLPEGLDPERAAPLEPEDRLDREGEEFALGGRARVEGFGHDIQGRIPESSIDVECESLLLRRSRNVHSRHARHRCRHDSPARTEHG